MQLQSYMHTDNGSFSLKLNTIIKIILLRLKSYFIFEGLMRM